MTTMVGTKSSMRSSGERGCDGSRPDVNDRKAPMSKYMTPMVKGDGGLPRRPPSSEVLPLPLWLLVVTMLLRVFCGCFSPESRWERCSFGRKSNGQKRGKHFLLLKYFFEGVNTLDARISGLCEDRKPEILVFFVRKSAFTFLAVVLRVVGSRKGGIMAISGIFAPNHQPPNDGNPTLTPILHPKGRPSCQQLTHKWRYW